MTSDCLFPFHFEVERQEQMYAWKGYLVELTSVSAKYAARCASVVPTEEGRPKVLEIPIQVAVPNILSPQLIT